MEKQKKPVKKPVSNESIFKTMMILTFAVAAAFLAKNLLSKDITSAIMIGICLIVFGAVMLIMRKLKLAVDKQQLVVCLSIVILQFIVSLNSGNYYSDDFPLYLAVVGLSGLYLRPTYTLIQIGLIDVLLVAQYLIHPEKADPLSQFIMCVLMFTIAAFTFYLAIKRGRAFIELNEEKNLETAHLLHSLTEAGRDLQENCETSTGRISGLQAANERLDQHASQLRQGSDEITNGTHEVAATFDEVQDHMHVTEEQIHALNGEVKKVEQALANNDRNMQSMISQIESIKATVQNANEVFAQLQAQIQEVSATTGQLRKIASNTTILALNASIEAARAGQAGAGFAVVATKVQDLANDSTRCSSQVDSVVDAMQEKIQATVNQLATSSDVINSSIQMLGTFQEDFSQLSVQFGSLYQNIEAQNQNISRVDDIMDQLKGRIHEMAAYSEENQNTVSAIAEAMDFYKENMDMVIGDTQQIYELSVSMLERSEE